MKKVRLLSSQGPYKAGDIVIPKEVSQSGGYVVAGRNSAEEFYFYSQEWEYVEGSAEQFNNPVREMKQHFVFRQKLKSITIEFAE